MAFLSFTCLALKSRNQCTSSSVQMFTCLEKKMAELINSTYFFLKECSFDYLVQGILVFCYLEYKTSFEIHVSYIMIFRKVMMLKINHVRISLNNNEAFTPIQHLMLLFFFFCPLSISTSNLGIPQCSNILDAQLVKNIKPVFLL